MPSTASTARSRSANCGPVLPGAEVAPVGVDVLAEQRDLGDAVGGELLDLVHDVAHAAADLGAAHDGTMQNAHELSQPIWIVTQAEWSTSRRAGSADGYASCSSRISTIGPSSRAAREQLGRVGEVVGAEHDVDVRRPAPTMSSRSFWARQPPTAIWRSGRASFSDLRWPRWP